MFSREQKKQNWHFAGSMTRVVWKKLYQPNFDIAIDNNRISRIYLLNRMEYIHDFFLYNYQVSEV